MPAGCIAERTTTAGDMLHNECDLILVRRLLAPSLGCPSGVQRRR
jgi:hypothetical protein